MSKDIVVTKRTSDYHACLKDHPELWGCGNSPNAAIGNLIASHGVTFDIGIAYNYTEKFNDTYLKMQGVEIIGGK